MKIPLLLSVFLLLLAGCGPDIPNLDSPGSTIVCLGDSITSGVGAAGQSYPGLLADKLGVEVINAGVPGDTSDQTISLYMRDPATGQYVLQEQEEDLVGGFGLQDRNWTVGRGMYANNPADWVNGFVDEVRISDSALSTGQFLGAVPEPSALGVLAVAGLFALRRRRRVAHRWRFPGNRM